MTKKSSYEKIFQFLKTKEQLQETFNLKEISDFCGIQQNTILKYFSEKISHYIIKEKLDNKNVYKVKNILDTPFTVFESDISQANPNNKISHIERYYNRIVDKSFDAFLVSIENYNKPHLKNKVEVFAILIINAWELLLKAKIIKDSDSIESIFKQVKGKEEYTISIEECVKKTYSNTNVIRDNLLQLICMRDKATHLLIEEIRFSISQVFQASIINYINEYKNNFGQMPLTDDMAGMLCLIIPGNDRTSEIKNIYGEKTEYEINNFLNQLKELNKHYESDQFMTTINYNVFLQKQEEKAHLKITNGLDGKPAIVLERIIEIKDKYKFTYTDIVNNINLIYPKFTTYIMNKFIKKYNIYSNRDYCYIINNTKVYSEKFLNFIKETISNNSNFFIDIKT